jgi:hypothetical protein
MLIGTNIMYRGGIIRLGNFDHCGKEIFIVMIFENMGNGKRSPPKSPIVAQVKSNFDKGGFDRNDQPNLPDFIPVKDNMLTYRYISSHHIQIMTYDLRPISHKLLRMRFWEKMRRSNDGEGNE